MTTTTTRITGSIMRALRSRSSREVVHFHLQRDGRPYVCDVHRCDSPALTLADVDR